MDIITDPSYSRTMGPDIALGSNSGPDITMAPVAAGTTQISMAPAAEWDSDTYMVSGS